MDLTYLHVLDPEDLPLIPSGELLHNYERATICNGKIHYFDWAIFNSYLFVFLRKRSSSH